jgi:hypothetical protein
VGLLPNCWAVPRLQWPAGPIQPELQLSFRAKTAGDIPPNKNEMFHNTHQTRGHQMNRQSVIKSTIVDVHAWLLY